MDILRRHRWMLFLALGCCFHRLYGQRDTTVSPEMERRISSIESSLKESFNRLRQSEQSTFYLYKYLHVADTSRPNPPIAFTGYVDAYYAYYLDSTGTEFVRFPTVSPRSGQFGLNMFYFGMKLDLEKARANIGLHLGDIPESAWSVKTNLIQEANAGIQLVKNIWLDAGFFRTHIGMESIQPRENICQSLANTTYFEPYFLSGAKLTWQVSDQLSIQAQAFNGFNTFQETNRNKAFGLSGVWVINDRSLLTMNTLLTDESPDSVPQSHYRLYNDFYYLYRSQHIELGAEANFGIQERSRLDDPSRMAMMYSGIVAAKYKTKHFGFYGRGELFEDSHEILTGPLENENHQLVGLNLWGATAGVEFRPVPTSYLRLEARHVQTTPNETIFHWHGRGTHSRQEVIAAMAVWF